MTARKLWLNGMTCLGCGEGWYDGYDTTAKLTRPCQKCGHQAPERMSRTAFKKAYTERDRRLYGTVSSRPQSEQ